MIKNIIIQNVFIHYEINDKENINIPLILEAMNTHSWTSYLTNKYNFESVTCTICKLSLGNINLYPSKKLEITCNDMQLKNIIE